MKGDSSEYNPIACGARCGMCPLHVHRIGDPVPPELRHGDTIVVADSPGKSDCDQGRPLMGESGHVLERALSSVGVYRNDVSLTNALLCRPAGNDLTKFLARVERANKKRRKDGRKLIPSPFDCCKPRLDRELEDYSNVLALGNYANRVLTGTRGSITSTRAMPVKFAGKTIVPTYHPSYVLRDRKQLPVFYSDVSRAIRYFRGTMHWDKYRVITNPSVDDVVSFFKRHSNDKWLACDIETDWSPGQGPLDARVNCIGVGDCDEVIVMGLVSRIDNKSWLIDGEEKKAILHQILKFLTGPIIKLGHNFGQYDNLVLSHWLGQLIVAARAGKADASFAAYPLDYNRFLRVAPIRDTILFHKAIDGEQRHDLFTVGTLFTDVPDNWKADHAGSEAGDDGTLHAYNAVDVIVNARAVKPLSDVISLKQQNHVVAFDHKTQKVCVNLHRLGIRVDLTAVKRHDKRLLIEAQKYQKECREACELGKINLRSVQQVSDLLYENWRLPVLEKSKKTDAPSTGDDAILALLREPGLNGMQARFLKSLRLYRRAIKLRGTYIVRMRPRGSIVDLDEYAEDEELEELLGGMDARLSDADVKYYQKHKSKTVGLVYADGRVRSTWNAHTQKLGRVSSSDPNLQNQKRSAPGKPSLRDMFIPSPGHCLVEADKDQLELRYASAKWKAVRYIETFIRGEDPHAITAKAVFGDKYIDKVVSKALRDFAKTFVYACLYGASDETVHAQLMSTEDSDGVLIYLNLKLDDTINRRRKWLSNNPEFERGWKTEMSRFEHQGCLYDSILGRRINFANAKPTEINNADCQAGGRVLVAMSEHELCLDGGAFEFEFAGPNTGLVHDGHDALMIEVPIEKARWAARELTAGMTNSAMGMQFTADASIKKNWSTAYTKEEIAAMPE